MRLLLRGLRADAVGTILGGVFNTFPYTSYSQNVGLVGMTGVRSRYVCVAGGLIMLALGLCPKLAAKGSAHVRSHSTGTITSPPSPPTSAP